MNSSFFYRVLCIACLLFIFSAFAKGSEVEKVQTVSYIIIGNEIPSLQDSIPPQKKPVKKPDEKQKPEIKEVPKSRPQLKPKVVPAKGKVKPIKLPRTPKVKGPKPKIK